MIRSAALNTRNLIGATLALSMAAVLAAQPAQAQNGDIAKGILIGVATGVVVNQIAKDQARRQGNVIPDNGWQQPQTRMSSSGYQPDTYTRTTYAPATYAPAPEWVSRPIQQVSPTRRAFNSQERQLRISIQYQLMQNGFYDGAIDGAWGPRTQQALFSYARSRDQVAMLTTVRGTNQLFSDILR